MSLVRLRGSVCVPCQGVGQFWKSMLKVRGRVTEPPAGGLQDAACSYPDISPKNALVGTGAFPLNSPCISRGLHFEKFKF